MPKRKRILTANAKPIGTLSTSKVKKVDTAEKLKREDEEEEDFEPESISAEEGSEAFDPELDGGGNKKRGKKKATARKSSVKAMPKKKDENGDSIVRAPQVNSDYLPLPWKGRLGYACLNTYLRTSNPPIFCSRTCRISTILQKGSAANGQVYVKSLGLQNAWDFCKMIRWNEKYGIKFLRISSAMFPFASHAKYGYSLDFAAEPLREAGRLAMKFGHRLTTHPGQYTQLASPKKEVITASVRDLEYHSQLLQLLRLEEQANRDAVIVLHMGGVFGDKKTTLGRFRESYTTLLSDDIKARLVLENDDVGWTVHDLLPICHELNIPLVLDYHHHNICHRDDLCEGTLDLLQFLPEIKQTWTRKNITQKQHYSEARDTAITNHDMRKHSKRVRNLPPCDSTMDLMIEAKDKEQAVFELYRKYDICEKGFLKEMVPHERTDENAAEKPARGKKAQISVSSRLINEGDLAMGGEERRVYWPEGKEEWLSPPKRYSRGEARSKHEEIKVVVGSNKKSRKKTKQPIINIGEADPSPKAAKVRRPPARKQRTTAKTRNEGEGEPVSAGISPVVVVPAARKTTKKAVPTPSEPDSDLSSPPTVSNDEGLYEGFAGATAVKNTAWNSDFAAGSEEVDTISKKTMFRVEKKVMIMKRRDTRARSTVEP